MPLHRDIYWVGRQWAVTGYGMQAVDQRLNGVFDIGISRLWDDGLAESLSAGAWLNTDDFAKALFIARAKFPEPAQKTPLFDPAEPGASCPEERAAIETPNPVQQNFDMRIESWTAKLVPSWRVLRQR